MSKYIRMIFACGGIVLCTVVGYSGEVSLSASELLEEGVYLQEAKGDLDAAIARYKQVIELDAKNRPRAAEAQYRLAVCYLEQGNDAAATQAFEALASDFPNQTKWVEAALDHLPKTFEPSFIPWEDGELTEMEIRLPNGDIVGGAVIGVSQFEHEGRPSWKFSNRQFARGIDLMESATVDPESMLPLEGHYYDSNSGSVTYLYEEGLVRTRYQKNGNERELAFEGKLYSNGQALALVRQFPPEVGFSTEQNIYVPLAGAIVPMVFKIKRIETVETPIGAFECYYTEIDIMGQKQGSWITNDEKRRLVRLTFGGAEVTVTRFRVIEAEAKTVYDNEQLGFTFEHPNPWAIFETNVNGGSPDKSRLELREPNSITTISVATIRYESTEDEESSSVLEQARNEADKHIKAYKQRSPEFEVDPESWSEFEINGATALSYFGEYIMAGKPTISKKIFVYSKGRRLTFTLLSPLDEVKAMLPLFDEIAASVKIE